MMIKLFGAFLQDASAKGIAEAFEGSKSKHSFPYADASERTVSGIGKGIHQGMDN